MGDGKQYFNPECAVDSGPYSSDGSLSGITIEGQTFILRTVDLKRLHYAIACGLDRADELARLYNQSRAASMRAAIEGRKP